MSGNDNVAGIYLAAGLSRRMGESKLNLPFEDTLLGSCALRTAMRSQLSRIIIVVKTMDEPWLRFIIESNPDKEYDVAVCEASDRGQAESVKCGLNHLRKGESAAMILLADQPFITESMINTLIRHHQNWRTADFVAARSGQIPRPPVIFNESMFPVLQKLQGDSGARKLIQAESPYHGVFVEFHDPSLFIDIDTKNDYELAVKHIKEKS